MPLYRIDRAIVVRDVMLGFPRIYPRDADTNAPSYRANMYRCGTRTPLHPRYTYTPMDTPTPAVFFQVFESRFSSRLHGVLFLTSL